VSDTDAAVRCSVWARQVDLSPVATIGSYRGYLLVETPLPWLRDIAQIPELAEAGRLAAQEGLRLQALVPSELDAEPADRRVILHFAGDGPFSGYRRIESAATGSIVGTARRLLEQAAASAVSAGEPVPSAGDPAPPATDVLVCTHGRRDVCCGSQGTDLALQLAAQGPPAGVHVRRTSHTGGHRFAPTFIVLPQGTGWAFADPALVAAVLRRSVPFSQVSGHYRGCAGLPGPQVQALERTVLEQVGWDLLDRPRRGFLTGETTAEGGTIARLEAGPDRWEGVVRPGRTLPVPDCMMPLSQARKTETEWVVADVRAVA
jgi:hypothetical protein